MRKNSCKRCARAALLALLLTLTACAARAPVAVHAAGTAPEELVSYFCEIAFGSELGEGSDRLCRWTGEIVCALQGDFTRADEQQLTSLAALLNGINGFPGIRFAAGDEAADLTVSFLSREELVNTFGTADAHCDGISEYTWDRATGEILSARAGIDRSLTAGRAGVVAEEFLQALGLAQDSLRYPDSLFYEGQGTAEEPSELDISLLRLLYHPSLRPGMTPEEALPGLRRLTGQTEQET